MPRTFKTEESRSSIVIDFQGVSGLLTTVADRIFQSEISISHTQYALLITISSLESPVSESDVAEKLHRGLNTISMLVDRMVKAGMIDRSRSKDDRRKCIVSLTPLGKEKLVKGKKVNETLSQRLFNELGEKEINDIQNLLTKLEASAVKELSV